MESGSYQSRALVVDDHPNWCKSLRRVLVQAGYSVEVVSSREEALQLLESCVFDVAVVDMVLEKGRPSTYEGVRLLQDSEPIRRERGTQAILLTGHDAPDYVREQLAQLDLIACLHKHEWNRQTFLAAVQKGAKKAQAARRTKGSGNVKDGS